MPKDYAQLPLTAVRRDDRVVDDEAWIKRFLHTAAVGTLATVHDGQPFVNTNLFVYDEAAHCIYTHTARVGRTRANVEAEPRVSFSIMEMGRLLPADEALEFSVEYAGVTIFGQASLIDDETDGISALQMLMDKYAPHLIPGQDYRAPILEELKRTSVFRISIEAWTGKRKSVDGFPGAYWYEDQPVLPSVVAHPTWRGVVQMLQIAPAEAAPVQIVDSVQALPGRGLEGDRYAIDAGSFSDLGREGDAGREVTLIAQEDIEAVNSEANLGITAMQTRRNIVTQGVPLNYLVGKTFRVGEVVLRGMRLCEPCEIGRAHV